MLTLAPGVSALFTTRAGGVSDAPYDELNLGLHVGDDPARVVTNRSRLAHALGPTVARTTWCQQVHGAGVSVVEAGDVGRGAESYDDALPGTDALVTALPGTPLAVLVADCVPVLLADRDGNAVAAVHAGRRGLVAGVLQAALAALYGAGARAGDVVAAIGPAIGRCCYEVGDDVFDEVTSVIPVTAARSRSGARSLDLPAGVRHVLATNGVREVHVAAGCTADDPARYFSHRRDGVTGRMAGVVWRHGR